MGTQLLQCTICTNVINICQWRDFIGLFLRYHSIWCSISILRNVIIIRCTRGERTHTAKNQQLDHYIDISPDFLIDQRNFNISGSLV